MDEQSADEPSARESFDEERERLRRLLVEKGFLTASHTARLFSRSGRSMSWMLYTPAITMTSEGSWLAGRCLLRRLEQFKGSQLATYGYTGLPLMIASLTLANGRYRGLVVGDKPNSDGHGVVEGDGSRPGPVVVIDDSLVSGTSFFRAARLLEEDGFQVEGLICLVEFPGRGGRAFAEAAGYRVEAVYELDRDLEISRLEAITSGFSFQSASTQSASTLAPGPPMDPVVAARRVAEAWPNSDRVAEEASCPHGQAIHSGAVVEFRDGKTGRLVARDGVVSPSGPAISCTAAAAATVKAIMRRSGSQLQSYGLDGIRISVKLLTQAEEIAPREIDAARYALVVQSQMNPARVGYALRDDRRRTEIALYLAAQQMAGLGTAEPHTIYRCLEQEMAEPGVSHITSRRAVDLEVSAIAALAGLARATISGIPDTVSDGLVAGMDLENLDIHGAGVGWYEEGRLLGCWLSWGSSLAIAVRRAAARAWQLCGRTQPTASEARDLKVLITLLHEPRHLGELSVQAAAEAFDLGEETLVASAGDHSAAVFPHFMCHHGWSGRQTADLALRKAGIRGPSAMWSAYRTTSWLDGQGLQFPIEHGFPIRPAGPVTNDRFGRSARAVADFIARHVDSNGLPVYQYDPLTDSVVRDGPIGRIIFALDALAEAASVLGNDEWAAIARNGLQVCVDQLTTAHQGVSLEAKGRPKSAAADCELLAALASWLPATLEQPAVFSLVQQVLTFFKADGMISDLAPGFRAGTDHDILPGVALVALGRYARHAGSCNEAAHLEEQLAWYRRRFRLCRSWAMIGWQMQGWSVLWDVAAVRGARDFVFEMADWAISLQLDKNGAFLTDLAVVGPSFHTACVAEGVVEAWRLAAAAGQSERVERYANSWRRNIDFMGSLTVEEIDGNLLPNPRRALGGVRPSLSDSRLRIDYSAHLLRALVRGMALMEHSF